MKIKKTVMTLLFLAAALPARAGELDMLLDRLVDKNVLDPGRYDMPEQTYDLTLGNVRGKGSSVRLWDPMVDSNATASVLSTTATSLTVRLSAADYPRFLIVKERAPGPLVLHPTLSRSADGARVSFGSNVRGTAVIQWGPFPSRLAPAGQAGGERRVPVRPGRAVEELLSGMSTGMAVRVTLEAGGLSAPWPRWDWDVQGVYDFAP